ncbi:MAG: hypothetical protein C4B55_02160 [Candidatus Methanophagaceae archaeon]|nr:MAG: hypothetical protein C4B55_02160 [Methanophagales archaeon]
MSEKYLAEGKELLSKADLEQASEKFWGAAALKNLSLKKKALPKKKEVNVEMKRSRGEIVGSALLAAFAVVVVSAGVQRLRAANGNASLGASGVQGDAGVQFRSAGIGCEMVQQRVPRAVGGDRGGRGRRSRWRRRGLGCGRCVLDLPSCGQGSRSGADGSRRSGSRNRRRDKESSRRGKVESLKRGSLFFRRGREEWQS